MYLAVHVELFLMLVVAIDKKELVVDANNEESIVAVSFEGAQPIYVPKS